MFFVPSYQVTARRSELEVIDADEEHLILSVIMTVPENPQDMSANLMAPLIFNMKNRLAMQYVLTKQKFPVKYFVLENSPTIEESSSDDDNAKTILLR